MPKSALFSFVFWTLLMLLRCTSGRSDDTPNYPGEPLYLTPLIEARQIVQAQESSRFLGKYLSTTNGYSGYLTINKEYKSNMFFVYLPAKVNQKVAPVIVWVGGGPGMSSLYSVLFESGPIIISEGDDVSPNRYSWNCNYNMIYIDSPIGTGYSFTDDDAGYARSDQDVGEQLYAALKQLYTLFPELQTLPLYIAGNSYGGRFAIALGLILHRDKKERAVESAAPLLKTRFTGLIIGSGIQEPITQLHFGNNLYNVGLLSKSELEIFQMAEDLMDTCIDQNNTKCSSAVFNSLMSTEIDRPEKSLFSDFTGFDRNTNFIVSEYDARPDLLVKHVTTPGFRKLLHVGSNPFQHYSSQSKVVQFLLNSSLESTAPSICEILNYYPVCLYFGQADMILPYTQSIKYIQTLQFQGAAAYKKAKRQIWYVGDEVAGYMKTGGNLLEVMVRNAGHRAAGDQPEWVLDMVKTFINGVSFEG